MTHQPLYLLHLLPLLLLPPSCWGQSAGIRCARCCPCSEPPSGPPPCPRTAAQQRHPPPAPPRSPAQTAGEPPASHAASEWGGQAPVGCTRGCQGVLPVAGCFHGCMQCARCLVQSYLTPQPPLQLSPPAHHTTLPNCQTAPPAVPATHHPLGEVFHVGDGVQPAARGQQVGVPAPRGCRRVCTAWAVQAEMWRVQWRRERRQQEHGKPAPRGGPSPPPALTRQAASSE